MSEYNGNGANGHKAVEHRPVFQSDRDDEDNNDFFSELDFGKLWIIFTRNIFWLILFPIAASMLGYVFLRYTKPLYQSSSTLKLDVKNESSILGFQTLANDDVSDLSGEIELIKSKLIFDEVIRIMRLDVTYFAEGNILDEERYLNSPFQVEYTIKSNDFYDTRFNVDILSSKQFRLRYKLGDHEVVNTYTFGVPIENDQFHITLRLNSIYDDNLENQTYYFIINNIVTLNDYMAKNLKVDVLNPTARIIQISFTDHSIVKARDMVNAIDSVYLVTTLNDKNKANKQKLSYLDDQLRLTEDSLDRYEKRIQDFVIANKGVDLEMNMNKDVEKIEGIIEKKAELKAKLSYLADVESLLKANQSINRYIPFIAAQLDPQLTEILTTVNQYQQERDITLSSTKENTVAANGRNKLVDTAKKNAYDILAQERSLINGRISELTTKLGELESTLVNIPGKNADYTKIKRTYTLYEEIYLDMMSKKAELGIAGAGTVPEFVVLSPANLPKVPVSPNKIIVYSIAGAIGIFFSFSAVILMYFLNNTITSQRELEKLTGAPVLGIVPVYDAKKAAESRMVIDKNPKSAMSEALRLIRTNLDFMFPIKNKKRIIAVTSTVSGEGKTFVVVNLGGIIAMSDVKVVLLDLDMRKPKVHVAFGTENRKGISTILINKHKIEECVNKTTIPTLDYISAGPTPPNPSELILRPEFDKLLEDLKQVYDYILIDTPPVGLVTDGLLVMTRSDLPLYVVRADYSKRSVVNNINKLLRNQRFGNLTVILNALRNEKDVYKYDYGGYSQGYYDDTARKVSRLKRLEKMLLKR